MSPQSGSFPISISANSLRAELAARAAIAGTSTDRIGEKSGHASDAMLARNIRDHDLFQNTAAGLVL